jgi:hypothetical protein
MSPNRRRELIFRRILAREAGANADAAGLAVAARRLNEHLARELTPLIGALGVDAIYSRSLHLAQQQYPSLVPGPASNHDNGSISRAEHVLEHQESAVAFAVAMFSASTELLASFIGEALTTSLLRKAWPDDFAGSATEDIT